MPEEERRKSVRKPLPVTTVVRKSKSGAAGGEFEIMEFRTKDVSNGGVFISTENLALFELGEEIEILVDDGGERFYEGVARIVRSARVFSEEGNPVESGYGVMFLHPETDAEALPDPREENGDGC